jgi:hypothetical protein
MNQLIGNPGDSGTGLADAIFSQLQASKDQVARLNKDVKLRYDGLWNNYVINVESGQRDNSNPPQPPMAWELSPALPTDGSDPDYFVFYAIGKTPICAMPPLPNSVTPVDPSTLPKNMIVLGKNFYGKWFAVGPYDTFPVGMTTPPQADGHMYEKFGAPVGPGWYLQVA